MIINYIFNNNSYNKLKIINHISKSYLNYNHNNRHYITTNNNRSNNNNYNNNKNQILNHLYNTPYENDLYFKVYKLMGELKMDQFKSNSGKLITRDELLQRELINNINNDQARVELIKSTLLSMVKHSNNNSGPSDDDDDYRLLPTYIYKSNRSTANDITNINQFTNYSKIEMLLILLDINQDSGFALSNLCHLMLSSNIKQIKLPNSNSVLTLQDIAIRNYLVNSNNYNNSSSGSSINSIGSGNSNSLNYSDDNDKCYYYLVDALYPNSKTFNLKDGTLVKLEDELIKGIEKNPNNSLLYYYLSTLLQDNKSNVNLNGKALNRIDLLVLAIEKEHHDYIYVSNYYYYIAKFINSNSERISIGAQSLDRIQLLISSLELNSNTLSAKLLVELLEPYQKVIVNDESYSRVALINCFIVKDHPHIGYQLLSMVYKQENNIQKSIYYNKLYLKELSKLNQIKSN